MPIALDAPERNERLALDDAFRKPFFFFCVGDTAASWTDICSLPSRRDCSLGFSCSSPRQPRLPAWEARGGLCSNSKRISVSQGSLSTKQKKTLAARPQPLLRPPALPPPSSPVSSGLAALPPLAAATTTLPRSPEPRAPPTSSPGSSSSPSTRCGLFRPFLFFNLPNLKKSTRSPHAAQLALFLHSPSLSLPPLALDPFAGQARARQRVQARPGRRCLPGPRGLHLGLRGRAQRADQVRESGVLLSRVFF